MNLADLKYLLWFHTAYLGDLALLSGPIQLVSANYPAVRQVLLTNGVGAELFAGQPGLAKIITMNKRTGLLPTWRKLRAELHQLIAHSGDSDSRIVLIQAHRSPRSTILTTMLGYPTVRFHEASLGFRFGTYANVAHVKVLHESQRLGLLLEPLGVDREQCLAIQPKLTVPAIATSPALQANFRWVAVAPGSVWGTKRWPVERYLGLVEMLLSEEQIGVVLIGSNAEIADCQMIAEGLSGVDRQRLVNLCGHTTIVELLSVLAQCQLLVANDSAPVHLASGIGIPTVAIFGATIPAFGYGPRAERSRTVEVPLDCRPCGDHGPMTCPLGHFRCMRNISAQSVLEQCRAILA